MGDRHLTLQNGLSGLIASIFFLFGLQIFNAELAQKVISEALEENKWQLVVAIVTLPIIGFIVNIIKLWFQPSYGGIGRKIFSTRLREAIRNSNAIDDEIKEKIMSSSDDSLFVCFLYNSAPQYLIEWVRRRRDIHQMGLNWIIASIIGLLGGIVIGVFSCDWAVDISILLRLSIYSLILVLWFICLWRVGRMAIADAEGTELTLLCSHLDPGLRRFFNQNDKTSNATESGKETNDQ